MTPEEISEKAWDLWNDYYKGNDDNFTAGEIVDSVTREIVKLLESKDKRIADLEEMVKGRAEIIEGIHKDFAEYKNDKEKEIAELERKVNFWVEHWNKLEKEHKHVTALNEAAEKVIESLQKTLDYFHSLKNKK